MAKAMLVVSQELTRPAQATPEEDVQNCDNLGHSPNEVSDRQHRFAEAATARYLDESSDLTALMTKIANQGFNAGTRGAKR
jgi:hypothetical protein